MRDTQGKVRTNSINEIDAAFFLYVLIILVDFVKKCFPKQWPNPFFEVQNRISEKILLPNGKITR